MDLHLSMLLNVTVHIHSLTRGVNPGRLGGRDHVDFKMGAWRVCHVSFAVRIGEGGKGMGVGRFQNRLAQQFNSYCGNGDTSFIMSYLPLLYGIPMLLNRTECHALRFLPLLQLSVCLFMANKRPMMVCNVC